MRQTRNLIAFGLLMHILVCASSAEAGWKLRWWDKKDDCPQHYCPPQCNQPHAYGYYHGSYCCNECQEKKKKEKKHCCCCRGDIPELAPIVRSVAANITNQQAVPIQQTNPGPIKMTLQQDDAAGQQPDRPSGAGQQPDRPAEASLDSRVAALEQELEN